MEKKINLSGEWDVFIDFSKPVGQYEEISKNRRWSKITVPGCWEQAERDKKSDGPVWYRKIFTVPEEWNEGSVAIHFEGVNYYSEAWLNGTKIGSHEGGWNGFELDISNAIDFSNENELLVKVYKQGDKYPVRECLAGFFPDVGVIFGGIWKPVTVKLQPSAKIEDVFVKPNIQEEEIVIEFDIKNHAGISQNILLQFSLYNPSGELENTVTKEVLLPEEPLLLSQSCTVNLKNDIQLWNPEEPMQYRLETKVLKGEQEIFADQTRFGMRELHIKGDQIYLNGNPLYVRGVLHWGWYSETIAPIPTRDEIREELRQVKESGFNLVKHCLYVPTKDYFEIADELGIFIWQELPLWLPQVSSDLYNRVFYQYDRIIREIRNHPSIILWTLGCELDHSVNADFLSDLYKMVKVLTNNAIIRDNSGSGECYGGLLKEYADFYDYHFYNDVHFYRDLINQFAGSWRENKPWVFGEFCDYDVFRDIEAVRKQYNGELPWWLKDDLIENPGSKEERWNWYRQEAKMELLNLPFSSQHIVENSNRSAYVYRKAVLELVRSYQKITGYVLTSIKGNPIATSSIFNDFGEPNHVPAAFKQFNNSTVISLTWDNRRNWVNGGDRLINWDPNNYSSSDIFRPHMYISHYDRDSITIANLYWELIGSDQTLASGEVSNIKLSPGEAKEVGIAEVILPEVQHPTKILFKVKLTSDKEEVLNEWPFWIFPKRLNPDYSKICMNDPLHLLTGLEKVIPDMNQEAKGNQETKVIVTSLLQPEHFEFLEQGGRVFYIQRGEGEFPVQHLPFWRESIQLFHSHPVMNTFPHEDHTGMVFYGIATDTAFENMGKDECAPIMDRLDARTFELNNYLFERSIGKGKLIATTLRFEGGLGAQPTGINHNPAGLYLFEAIIKYLLDS
ncbi:glycoside hydrolase family 2 protein [Heyndrickxia sp. MSNUG]|uniref:glycoside hydrolase family 2 protein n=1 Tax=Heyndrickxia sp. MSNUG TaxID=3136677 RepID=UPI003C2F0181